MEDINKRVGIRIKEVRLERKLSREQVARRMGIKQQTIEKYEKGIRELSIRRLSQISNVLNVGITYLLDDGTFQHFVKKQIELKK